MISVFYRGEIPEDLPAAQTHECRVCNVSVKYLKEHLKNAHKITEHEYESLFDNDPDTKVNNGVNPGSHGVNPASLGVNPGGLNDSGPMVVGVASMGPGAMMPGRTIPKPPPLTPKPNLKIRQLTPTPEVNINY